MKNIIDQWIEQKLLGKECTFGDDRHLTNLILINKGKVFYNFLAKCYTDTPITIKRFATQQTRWGKSFLREYFINIKSKWIPEIKHHAPDVPIILIGTKSDLREELFKNISCAGNLARNSNLAPLL